MSERIEELKINLVRVDIIANSVKELAVICFDLCDYNECKKNAKFTLELIKHFPDPVKP
jgi:hypothetical protein